jgi:hypothetical protein
MFIQEFAICGIRKLVFHWSTSPLENMNHARLTGATHIMSETVFELALKLPVSGFTEQLFPYFHNLPHARCANRMPLGFQPAG